MRRNRRGSAMLEFTLVGIPAIFLLISVVELGRGLWSYHSLAYSINQTTRYVSVHGINCVAANPSCSITVGTIARRLANSSLGVIPDLVSLTLTSGAGDITCSTLTSCYNNSTVFPPANANIVGQDFRLTAVYTFASSAAMFWPGAGSAKFGTFNLPASARHPILF